MIEITKAAIAEINRMQTVRQQTDRKFRIGVAPGGCKSFHYTIELTEGIEDRDRVYDINGIAVAIDTQHSGYIDGLKLDYSEDLMGGAFRFQNARSISVCDCGNSFDI